MFTVEEILNEYEQNNEEIGLLLERNKSLTNRLKNVSIEEQDLVSVARASLIFDLSTGYIYQMIHRGKIKQYRQDNKVFVSKSEINGLIV